MTEQAVADPFEGLEVPAGLSMVAPGEIREALENPREISSERFAALKYALAKDPSMMFARPIIVDSRRGDVVAGNMRLRAATEMGWPHVPTYLKEFESDAQRREWMLRDNQEYGTWVPDELQALVRQHEQDGADLQLLGFSGQELEDLQSIGRADLPDAGDAGTTPPPEVFGIIVDCDDEEQQQALLEEFGERDLKCRALMV